MNTGFWVFVCVLAVCATIIICVALNIFFRADEGDPPKKRQPSQNSGPL